MELRQLEYFVAVVEEANFTRAAERVHISQSGVSAQIQALERELGATLIDRSGRTATPTTAGEAALRHAREVLASVDAIRQAVDDVSGLIRGRLAVGMVTGCTITPLFDALAGFHHAHPGIEIALLEDTSDRLTASVRGRALDLALVGAAGSPPPDLDSLTILSEGLVAAVPPGHPLASRRRAALSEVAAHRVVCLPAGTGVRAVFDESCAAAGLTPDVAFQASAPDAVADLVVRGMGVAILSTTMATDHVDRLTAVPVHDVDIPAVLALVWRPTPSPALNELVHRCRTAFGA
jgi:DNA-binding transcriptional LysR family regulator